MTAHPTRPDGVKPYEERDVAMRPIVVTALALLAIVVTAFVAVRLMDVTLVARESRRSAPANPLSASYGLQAPPAPRLQSDPRGDLAALRAREQALLDGWGWVDRDAGRVRIPVDRAVARVLEEAATR